MVCETLAQPELLEQSVPYRSLVLIVDDDHDQVEVLRWRLENQGYDTVAAHCGQQAVQMARQEQPDLILLDVRLPDVDGFRVCQQLADDPTTCSIPVIILSGIERPDIIRRARSAGGRYYVRKPYDPNVLLLLIQTALAEASPW